MELVNAQQHKQKNILIKEIKEREDSKMTNNTTMTINATNFNLDTLLSMLKDTGATVIIINNGNPIEFPVVETTATETVVKKHSFNYHAFYVGCLNKVLASHDIKVKTGKGGAKRGHISARAFDTLVKEMENKETSLKKVKFLFNALDEAGYPQEGRGLKNDVLFETLEYIKENKLAKEYSAQRYNKTHVQYELDNLVDKLVKIPFTNDFAIKFANCLREGDEVAYATFEPVDTEVA